MTITVNGIELNLDTDGASLGDVLANADDLVEKTGAVILGLRLDGTTVEADDLPGLIAVFRDREAAWARWTSIPTKSRTAEPRHLPTFICGMFRRLTTAACCAASVRRSRSRSCMTRERRHGPMYRRRSRASASGASHQR